MQKKVNKNIVVSGPTASGKTELALILAREIKGEVISADSRQIYKNLTIGTAKPAGVWQNGIYNVDGVPYRLVDFLDVDKTYNTSLFVAQAGEARAQITARGNASIFAGGTGMYLQSYFSGMDNLPRADEALRARLNAQADEHGKQFLHDELKKVDAASAAEIPAGNIHRVIRALEIYQLTGSPASALRTGKFNTQITDNNFFIYLNWDKEDLHARIIKRTQNMFEGMCAETDALLKQGYTKETPALRSLGYAQIIDFLQNRLTREQALEKIIILTRQYAKRQRTWFMRYKDIKIVDAKNPDIKTLIQEAKDFIWKE